MIITIEISHYPLADDYEEPIMDFINRMKEHTDITMRTNATSTHLRGEISVLMPALQQEMETSFTVYGKGIFVMKVLNGCLEI
ncbi:MAG: hypothetical protein IAE67_08775 [Candidatus Competibacteraceae bacterium]|nr:hypothetical protein [Candidatus Competibacteraceae bacterium]